MNIEKLKEEILNEMIGGRDEIMADIIKEIGDTAITEFISRLSMVPSEIERRTGAEALTAFIARLSQSPTEEEVGKASEGWEYRSFIAGAQFAATYKVKEEVTRVEHGDFKWEPAPESLKQISIDETKIK